MTLAASACAFSIADALIAIVSISLLAVMEAEEITYKGVLFHAWLILLGCVSSPLTW